MPKSPSFTVPVLRQVDVRRAHVAMDDPERAARRRIARRMHALERAQHLARDVDGDADRQELALLPEAAEQAIAVDAVDVLHREVRLAAVVFARVEDGDDVLVRHRRVEPRLALEHRPALGVGREVREQALDDEPLGEVRRRGGRAARDRPPPFRRRRCARRGRTGRIGAGALTRAEMVAIPPSYVTHRCSPIVRSRGRKLLRR